MKIIILYKEVAGQRQANKIINTIDTTYPDSKVANMVIHGASKEYMESIHGRTNEIMKKQRSSK